MMTLLQTIQNTLLQLSHESTSTTSPMKRKLNSEIETTTTSSSSSSSSLPTTLIATTSSLPTSNEPNVSSSSAPQSIELQTQSQKQPTKKSKRSSSTTTATSITTSTTTTAPTTPSSSSNILEPINAEFPIVEDRNLPPRTYTTLESVAVETILQDWFYFQLYLKGKLFGSSEIVSKIRKISNAAVKFATKEELIFLTTIVTSDEEDARYQQWYKLWKEGVNKLADTFLNHIRKIEAENPEARAHKKDYNESRTIGSLDKRICKIRQILGVDAI